jgi:hypothetical protein
MRLTRRYLVTMSRTLDGTSEQTEDTKTNGSGVIEEYPVLDRPDIASHHYPRAALSREPYQSLTTYTQLEKNVERKFPERK